MFKNINISSLYGPENKERKITDNAIFTANEIGFLKISGLQNFQFNERSKKILLSIFKLPEESKKNYVDGTLRIPIKMFTEAGSHYKMVCQLTNKELILVLTLFEK